jgi:hypothetical protein
LHKSTGSRPENRTNVQVRGVVVGVLALAVAGCSGSGGSGSAGSGGSGGSHAGTPVPSPTFTQLGTLAVSQVVAVRTYSSASCPAASTAFPSVVVTSGQYVACDPRDHKAYLLAAPAVRERDVNATTVASPVNRSGWTVYLQLSNRAKAALSAQPTKTGYAVVYDGTVIEAPVAAGRMSGGLIQISGLSKARAKRIAAALNPS